MRRFGERITLAIAAVIVFMAAFPGNWLFLPFAFFAGWWAGYGVRE